MKTKNQVMKLQGYDTSSKLCELQRDQPFSDVSDGKHFGMPISTTKFLYMLYWFWVNNKPGAENPFGDVWWVNFSKASILRILAQEGCEYIRFYFAIPEEGINQASLALEGVQSDGSPIKLQETLAVAGTIKGDENKDIEKNIQDLLKITDGNLPGNNEEKGNGGPPLANGLRDISSFKEFVDNLEKDFETKSFQDFIAAYYKRAKEDFS